MRKLRSRSTLVVMAGMLAVLVGCNHHADQTRTVFTVTGMHCDACSTSIVTTLEKVEGVESALADHETGVAEAIYRPRSVEVDALKAEIEKLGYTVIGMETVTVEG